MTAESSSLTPKNGPKAAFRSDTAQRLLGLFVRQDFLLVLAVLVKHQTVGGVLGILGGGIVAVLAASTLQSHEWAVALWHLLNLSFFWRND